MKKNHLANFFFQAVLLVSCKDNKWQKKRTRVGILVKPNILLDNI